MKSTLHPRVPPCFSGVKKMKQRRKDILLKVSLCQSLANEGTDLNMLGEKEFSAGKFPFGLMKAAFH